MSDYTVAIPFYNEPKELRRLLDQITTFEFRYRPREIVLLDDGSTDPELDFIESIYTSDSLPVVRYSTAHLGPKSAQRLAILKCKTECVILLHADTMITNPKQDKLPFPRPIIRDPIGMLYRALIQLDDAVAVGCMCLTAEYPLKVQCGPRGLGVDKMPYTYIRGYNAMPLLRVEFDDWQRTYSVDSAIMAIRRSLVEAHPFDEELGYPFYWDDWFAKRRKEGYSVYYTQTTVAYHPRRRYKPEGSLSVPTLDQYASDFETFTERYAKDPIWSMDSLTLKEGQIVERIGAE